MRFALTPMKMNSLSVVGNASAGNIISLRGNSNTLTTIFSGATRGIPMLAFSLSGHTAETVAPVRGPLVSTDVAQMVLGLFLVLLVIVGLAWLLRHVVSFQPTMNGQLRILGGLSMGPRERVVLVKIGDTQMLLGVSPGRIQTLHVLDKPVSESLDAPPRPGTGFAPLLSRFLQRGRGDVQGDVQ